MANQQGGDKRPEDAARQDPAEELPPAGILTSQIYRYKVSTKASLRLEIDTKSVSRPWHYH